MSTHARPRVVIWGAGGHAAVVADIVRLCGTLELVGFLDDVRPERRDEHFCGATILGGREDLRRLRADGVTHLLPGFGNPPGRDRVAELARDEGFELPVAVHPGANVAGSAVVGEGVVIKAGASIDPGVVLESHVIVGLGTTVGHDSHVGRGVTLSGGVHLAGRVRVGPLSWLGTGVCVSPDIHIGARSLVGIGAVVVRAIPDDVVAYGVPARVARPARVSDF